MERSQADLAAHAGMSRACINSIETDHYDPGPLVFKRGGSARRLASDFGASFE
jgi:hypothetical protein